MKQILLLKAVLFGCVFILIFTETVQAKSSKPKEQVFKKHSSKKKTLDSALSSDSTQTTYFEVENRRDKHVLIIKAHSPSSEGWYINIVDITGRMVAKSSLSSAQTITYFGTQNLKQRIYIIKVFDRNTLHSSIVYFNR